MKRTTKSKTADKPWMKMTPAELAAATRQYEAELDLADTRPLSAENRKWWTRAKRPGRPKVGKGAKPVLITVEQELLKQADAFAKSHKINRSQLFARGVEALLRKRAG